METKVCFKCKQRKNVSEFNKNKQRKDGLHSYCKICNRKFQKEWKNTPSGKKAILVYNRKLQLKREYGLTIDDYNKILESQKGVCAICGKPERMKQNGKIPPLCVDHCHKTGKNRGLLCQGCNIMLGAAKDNVQNLQNGAIYLINYNEEKRY